jgi:hypothetical protein
MRTLIRARAAAVLILLLSVASKPVWVQENSPIDLTGTWRWLPYEDERDRTPGAYPGDYRGLPLNDAARMRADTYDEEWNATSSLLQCRPRGPAYQAKGLDPMRVDQVVDPVSRQLVALRMVYEKTPGERMIASFLGWLLDRSLRRRHARDHHNASQGKLRPPQRRSSQLPRHGD